MPAAKFPAVVKAIYEATAALIKARDPVVPTELIFGGRTLFRNFSIDFVTISTTGSFPRRYANQSLVIRDQKTDGNRFSGDSLNPEIKSKGGLYCSVDQQAQVNETFYYARRDVVNPMAVKKSSSAPIGLPNNPKTGFPNIDAALSRRCVVQIRLMGSILALDLSRHNKAMPLFLERLAQTDEVQSAIAATNRPKQSLLDYLGDSDDCSAGRGIGLAVAHSDYLNALQATTVRPSDRSKEELGDNLIFFGDNAQQVQRLYVEKAFLFPLKGDRTELTLS